MGEGIATYFKKNRLTKPFYFLIYTYSFRLFYSTMNIKGISKSLIEKIIQNNLDNSKLEEINNYILNNYLNKIIKQKIDIFLLNF